MVEISGPERVQSVTIAEVDKAWKPVAGTERKIDCDTLLLSVGLIPENELSRKIGIELDPITGGPIVDEMMQTSVPGIFAGGNVVHVHDLVDNVTWEAEKAGAGAAAFVKKETVTAKGRLKLIPGENIRYVVPQTISGNTEVTLYGRVKEPQRKVQLNVGDIWNKKFRAVKPSEMIKIELSEKELKNIDTNTNELVVDCKSRE